MKKKELGMLDNGIGIEDWGTKCMHRVQSIKGLVHEEVVDRFKVTMEAMKDVTVNKPVGRKMFKRKRLGFLSNIAVKPLRE